MTTEDNNMERKDTDRDNDRIFIANASGADVTESHRKGTRPGQEPKKDEEKSSHGEITTHLDPDEDESVHDIQDEPSDILADRFSSGEAIRPATTYSGGDILTPELGEEDDNVEAQPTPRAQEPETPRRREPEPASETDAGTNTLIQFERSKREDRERREREDKEEAQERARRGYLNFLEQERTQASPIRNINSENPNDAPDYYKGNRRYEIPAMTEQEQAEHRARIELSNACRMKKAVNLEGFAELYKEGKAYEQIKNQELEILEGVPGYVECRMDYIRCVEDEDIAIMTYTREADGSLTEAGKLNWHKIDGEADWQRFRLGMQQRAVDAIRASDRFQEKVAGLDEDRDEYQYQLRIMTQSAEQVAYNFLYSQHFFEMNQSKWKEQEDGSWVRTRKSGHSSAAIAPLLEPGLTPVDVMVKDMLRDQVDVSKRTGQVITKHGHDWIKKNADRKKVDLKDIRDNLGEVVILPNKKKNEKKFWTFEKYRNETNEEKYRLFIYSQIPHPKMDQMCMLDNAEYMTSERDRVTFNVDGEDKSVLKMAREGRRIPWSGHKTASLFARTSEQAEKVNQYIQMVTSRKKLVSGTSGGGTTLHEWVNETNKSVSDIKMKDTDELIRGIVHASVDLDPKVAAPTARGKSGLKYVAVEIAEVGFSANAGQINYPWEKEAKKSENVIDRLLNKFSS